jgi:hypothetical protein
MTPLPLHSPAILDPTSQRPLTGLALTVEGRRVLLHLMAGSKEDAETVTAWRNAAA